VNDEPHHPLRIKRKLAVTRNSGLSNKFHFRPETGISFFLFLFFFWSKKLTCTRSHECYVGEDLDVMEMSGIYSAITRHNVHSAYYAAVIHEGNENGVLHL